MKRKWGSAADENWGLPTYFLLHSLASKNDAAYNWNLFWMANSLNVSTFLGAWLDFLLTSFVCSLLWVQLQSSYSVIFSCSLNLGYAICISHTTDAKYVSRRLMQITKRQCKPWTLETWCQLDHHCLNFLVWYFHYLTMNINVQGCIYKLTLTEQMYGPLAWI